MLRFALLALLLSAPPALADVFDVQTPSGNIQCSVGMDLQGSDIECTIIRKQGPPARSRPASCAAQWGHDFSMIDHGPVTMKCSMPMGASGMGGMPLDYGKTHKFGAITCYSARTGFQCVNRDGHGFFLSRAVQRVF